MHPADVNADYAIRTEPSETLKQLRTLSAAAANSKSDAIPGN